MNAQTQRRAETVAAAMSRILRAASVCSAAVLLDPRPSLAVAPALAPTRLTTAIPAEPLQQALESFAHQTGLQLVYVSNIVSAQSSSPVPAGTDASAALTQLLKGTGLAFEYLTPGSVHIIGSAPDAAPLRANGSATDVMLQEVVVTAERREEKLQDVPITIQVLSAEQLKRLGLGTFGDVVKYTSNISYNGNGPGTANIFIRGLGSPGTGNQTQSTIAPFPNVALYLDEQSMQFPARNNDLYMVDLERIEVLEGPQGTLFGGGAQAGAIRYITNKPRMDAVHVDAAIAYGITSGGADNYAANATLNLPLVADKLAVRAVGFSDRRGGYIANVPSTISFDVPSSIKGVRETSPVANNAGLVKEDTNPVTYVGFRLSGLYRISDDWDLLIQHNYQRMRADGYFYAYPVGSDGRTLGPDQITAFEPAFTKDQYESTAWTLDGRIGQLKAIYTGSYLRRHIDGQQDYSNYLRGSAGPYYNCIGTGADYFNSQNAPQLRGHPLQCYPPVGVWRDRVFNEHQSHEIRIRTDEQSRFRALVGAYWEKFVIDDDMNFNYLGIPECTPANLAIALAGGADCIAAVGPYPGAYASTPGLRTNAHTAFGFDVQRGYKQYAFFASVDFDLVPKVLTVTVGTRRYHYDEFEEGSIWSAAAEPTVDRPDGACAANKDACGFPTDLFKRESGFRSRANLTWHMMPDVMIYYTYSQGFRPGAFNRSDTAHTQLPGLVGIIGVAPYCGEPSKDPRCLSGGSLNGVNSRQGIKVPGYQSDNLINNELGLKSEFLNHRLRVNASAYVMRWKDVQTAALGLAGSIGGLNPDINGPTYTVKGIELQMSARIGDGFSVEGTGAWNSTKQTAFPCWRSSGITPLTPHNPTPAGECITIVGGLPFALGVLDSSTPFSPPVIFNLRAQYEWRAGTYHPYAWVGASHTGSQSNEPANFPDGNDAQHAASALLKYTIPGYTTYDAALGASAGQWNAQLTASNLTNSRAATNVSYAQFIKSTIPLRPRVITVAVSYRF